MSMDTPRYDWESRTHYIHLEPRVPSTRESLVLSIDRFADMVAKGEYVWIGRDDEPDMLCRVVTIATVVEFVLDEERCTP